MIVPSRGVARPTLLRSLACPCWMAELSSARLLQARLCASERVCELGGRRRRCREKRGRRPPIWCIERRVVVHQAGLESCLAAERRTARQIGQPAGQTVAAQAVARQTSRCESASAVSSKTCAGGAEATGTEAGGAA